MRKRSDFLKPRDVNHSATKPMAVLEPTPVAITLVIPEILPKILAVISHRDKCWEE